MSSIITYWVDGKVSLTMAIPYPIEYSNRTMNNLHAVLLLAPLLSSGVQNLGWNRTVRARHIPAPDYG